MIVNVIKRNNLSSFIAKVPCIDLEFYRLKFILNPGNKKRISKMLQI